jgi:16S rRNA (guanine527-N7)-methyltransferase
LQELYVHWNEQINVISRKDTDNFYERHVLHSLGIAKVIQFKKDTKIMDVGTGGGFPGIPLAILFPETQFYLIDIIAKCSIMVKGSVYRGQPIVGESACPEIVFFERINGYSSTAKIQDISSR